LKRTAAAILGVGAAFALAGCGTGSVTAPGNATHGKEVFIAHCAACHTLANAGAYGTRGPNLDDAFAFTRDAANKGDRFCQSTIRNVVRDQIRFPSGNNLDPQYVMPPNLVKGQDADDVATYVSEFAGVKPGVSTAPKEPSSNCS
jgi:mono/diheme cytochrome c family protein